MHSLACSRSQREYHGATYLGSEPVVLSLGDDGRQLVVQPVPVAGRVPREGHVAPVADGRRGGAPEATGATVAHHAAADPAADQAQQRVLVGRDRARVRLAQAVARCVLEYTRQLMYGLEPGF